MKKQSKRDRSLGPTTPRRNKNLKETEEQHEVIMIDVEETVEQEDGYLSPRSPGSDCSWASANLMTSPIAGSPGLTRRDFDVECFTSPVTFRGNDLEEGAEGSGNDEQICESPLTSRKPLPATQAPLLQPNDAKAVQGEEEDRVADSTIPQGAVIPGPDIFSDARDIESSSDPVDVQEPPASQLCTPLPWEAVQPPLILTQPIAGDDSSDDIDEDDLFRQGQQQKICDGWKKAYAFAGSHLKTRVKTELKSTTKQVGSSPSVLQRRHSAPMKVATTLEAKSRTKRLIFTQTPSKPPLSTAIRPTSTNKDTPTTRKVGPIKPKTAAPPRDAASRLAAFR